MFLSTKEVSAVLVTRGDVDLSEIMLSLKDAGFAEIVIWDNSQASEDMGPYGQYIAAEQQTMNQFVYFQDDDCVCEAPEQIVEAVTSLDTIICNMSEPYRKNYENVADKLMGFGACFNKRLIAPTFNKYLQHWPFDYLTKREALRIFTGLNKTELVDVPFRHLPWASAPNRLWKQKDHLKRLQEIRERIEYVQAYDNRHSVSSL